MMAAPPAGVATESSLATAWPPAALISSATALATGPSVSLTTTRAPRRASSSAWPRPIPRPAPGDQRDVPVEVKLAHRVVAWRPRPSQARKIAAPPLGVSRLPVRIIPDKLGVCEDIGQVPGVPGTGAGQRAEPHVRMRPGRAVTGRLRGGTPGITAASRRRRVSPKRTPT